MNLRKNCWSFSLAKLMHSCSYVLIANDSNLIKVYPKIKGIKQSGVVGGQVTSRATKVKIHSSVKVRMVMMRGRDSPIHVKQPDQLSYNNILIIILIILTRIRQAARWTCHPHSPSLWCSRWSARPGARTSSRTPPSIQKLNIFICRCSNIFAYTA